MVHQVPVINGIPDILSLMLVEREGWAMISRMGIDRSQFNRAYHETVSQKLTNLAAQHGSIEVSTAEIINTMMGGDYILASVHAA